MPASGYRDYFNVLGLEHGAKTNEIKNAFRKLARKYHPDLNQGDKNAEAKFKEINEAYEVLSDPAKRKKYEQFGQYWNQVGSNPGRSGMGMDSEFRKYGNFDEFLNDLLGRFVVNQSSNAFKNNPFNQSAVLLDAQITLKINFFEALNGTSRTLSVNDERVQIEIPRGVKLGSKLRIKGKGNLQPGTGKRGDLFINIDLQEHPIWKLDGDLVRADLPISLEELALGAIVSTITPNGQAQFKIPKGTLPGQSLRLKGKGFPKNNHCGDLIFKIILQLPDQWSSEELDLFNQLKKIRKVDPRKDWLKSAQF